MDQHPWIKSYPAGVRWNAEFATMPVPQILEQSAARWSDRSAIDFMGKKLTYRALDDLTNRAAKGSSNWASGRERMSAFICPIPHITPSPFSASSRRAAPW